MESQKYSALYRGHTSVSSGYSRHVIPWLVKEVERQARTEQVTLQLVGGSLVVADPSGKTVASHPVLQLSHFSQTVADPRCFLYLVKAGHGSHSMYLYQLRDKDMVMELFTTIQQHSRRIQQTQRSQSDASALSMSQLRRACASNGGPSASNATSAMLQPSGLNPHTASYFEVQYVCKIKTSHRKGPPSFIDDALNQFYEMKRRVAPLSSPYHHATATPDDSDYLHGEHSIRCGSTDSMNSIGSSTGGSQPAQSSSETRGAGVGETLEHCLPKSTSCEFTAQSVETRGQGGAGFEVSAPISVPKIQQTPATPQSTPCERHLSTVAESAESDSIGMTAVDGNVSSIPRSASTDSEMVLETQHAFRSRAMSGDTARMVRRKGQDEMVRSRAGSVGAQMRPRLGSMDHNYTMLFQVGKLELQLISPDNKAVKLHKYFRDVSQITQGQKNNDHFGFICRETPSLATDSAQPQKSSYVGYIFRCQNEKIAEDVISTLTTAFRSAYDVLRAGRRHHQQQCEYCPAAWYNRLCAELDGVTTETAQGIIARALDCLPIEDRRGLLVKLSGAELSDSAEQSEFLMTLLRFLCDEKQGYHTHVPTGQQPSSHDSHNMLFDLGSSLNKAKRSLTSRLEQVWKYNTRSREDSPHPEQLVLHQGSAATTPENSPCPTPTKAEFKYDYSMDTPVSARPRSSTIAGSSGEGYRREYRTRKQMHPPPQSSDSPMVAIFKRMGTGSDVTPSRHGTASWRQAIFNRIRTPGEKSPLVVRPSPPDKPPRRSSEQLRQLWRNAIHQQVLINRMQREDAQLTERVRGGERVMYVEMPSCEAEATSGWQQLINNYRAGGKLHGDDLEELVFRGVPLRSRAEVWHLLALHHRQTHPAPSVEHVDNYETNYAHLIKQLTSFQREILTDLGRTFPHHPYFRSPFGSGQLELFNVLKAVSLLDPELGYCQGMGFIAGILLLHMPEEESYEMLKHLLFSRELRKQFMLDMSPLQVQMYQFSRLVHDHASPLYAHLERYEMSPMLYATPWFLTLFSSQYPIGFCARVLDLVLLRGLEAVFQVALALLTAHEEELLALTSMEDIMEFIKTDMPRLSHTSADAIFKKAISLDISRQLLAYEVEYQVLQEEVLASPAHTDSDLNKLGTLNQTLKRQVMDLLQQLQSTSDQLKTTLERNKELEQRSAELESQRSDLVTFVRYLSLHTPDRLQIPAPFRRYLADNEVSASVGDVAVPRDPLNCAVFDSGPAARPRRNRQLATRSSSVDYCE